MHAITGKFYFVLNKKNKLTVFIQTPPEFAFAKNIFFGHLNTMNILLLPFGCLDFLICP